MANPVMHLNLHGEGCWPDLAGRKVIHKTELSVAGLAGGMASGRTSVTLRVDLDEQTTLLVETSLTLLEEAVAALRAAHGR